MIRPRPSRASGLRVEASVVRPMVTVGDKGDQRLVVGRPGVPGGFCAERGCCMDVLKIHVEGAVRAERLHARHLQPLGAPGSRVSGSRRGPACTDVPERPASLPSWRLAVPTGLTGRRACGHHPGECRVRWYEAANPGPNGATTATAAVGGAPTGLRRALFS